MLSAQEEEENLEEILLEQLSEELGEGVDVSEISEKLLYYLRHPIDINRANETDLNNLIFLSPQQIENFLLHRQISGNFISLLELQGIRGFDLNTISQLRPFIRLGTSSFLKGLNRRVLREKQEQMLMSRYGRNIEKQQGFKIDDPSRSRYLGDANRYAVRYRWNFENRIRIALNMEKDAGEPFFKANQKYGFDFYSGHIEFNEVNSYIRKIVIGDYALQFGQGLVNWNGLSFGKGAWIGSVARQGQGLRSYSSMNENNFQRGFAAKMQWNKWELTPFLAFNNLTGNRIASDENFIINTINKSGLHRTPTELSYRHAINEFVFGGNLSYRYRRLKLGITYMRTSYDGYRIKGSEVRNLFDFEGKSLNQIGLHYNYSYRNLYFFGETAHSIGSGLATNNGVIASLHPKVSLFANFRNYGRDYHNSYAQSLSEGSNVVNEKGLYSGLVYHPNRKIEWVNYIDVFEFPWLRFRVDAPSSGTDFLSQLSYSWHKKGKLTFRYRHRLKQENLSLPDKAENLLADVTRNQVRVDFQFKLNDSWSIKSRVDATLFEKELSSTSNGFLVYQDLFWQGISNKLRLNVRLAYFNTDDYDSRLYAYESDVLYASSFPMYYDKGIRTYLNFRWRVSRKIDFWGRYALTAYQDRENVGSALELIEGNKKSDVKFQMRWQW